MGNVFSDSYKVIMPYLIVMMVIKVNEYILYLFHCAIQHFSTENKNKFSMLSCSDFCINVRTRHGRY